MTLSSLKPRELLKLPTILQGAQVSVKSNISRRIVLIQETRASQNLETCAHVWIYHSQLLNVRMCACDSNPNRKRGQIPYKNHELPLAAACLKKARDRNNSFSTTSQALKGDSTISAHGHVRLCPQFNHCESFSHTVVVSYGYLCL